MNFHFFFQGKESEYDVEDSFQCPKCAPGCESCDDYSPCIASLNWVLRTILLVLQCIIIASLSIVVLFTIKYKEIKVGGTKTESAYICSDQRFRASVTSPHYSLPFRCGTMELSRGK